MLDEADIRPALPEFHKRAEWFLANRKGLIKRLAEIEREDEVEPMRAELADRFGPPPPAVETLLDVVGLRVAAKAIGVERIEQHGDLFAPVLEEPRPLAPAARRLDALYD